MLHQQVQECAEMILANLQFAPEIQLYLWDYLGLLKQSNEFFQKMSAMDGVRLPGERRHRNRLDKGPRKINKELIEKIKKLS